METPANRNCTLDVFRNISFSEHKLQLKHSNRTGILYQAKKIGCKMKIRQLMTGCWTNINIQSGQPSPPYHHFPAVQILHLTILAFLLFFISDVHIILNLIGFGARVKIPVIRLV